ncbi:hypothetical protein F3Y22_tig00111847pilonHSYRG00016 [Hibiscus syriacus]|uniref:Reverse transcriptase zinc-binding domain-containing protein n=1 Tax=Hibiscus syriacus TaxID=106335 RepID=A0A6A2YBP9_HIBSY|nr:hypothetical protein F3Y22_tig00111847pilonHSYRG00016 [Hibiscus syriacus]
MRPYLDMDAISDIIVIPPPTSEAGADHSNLRLESSGKCTIKTAYPELHRAQWNEEDDTWDLAWSFDSPQRVRNFIWVILRNLLLTNVERPRWGIVAFIGCPICRANEETIPHIIRDCTNARNVWSQIIWTQYREFLFPNSF